MSATVYDALATFAGRIAATSDASKHQNAGRQLANDLKRLRDAAKAPEIAATGRKPSRGPTIAQIESAPIIHR